MLYGVWSRYVRRSFVLPTMAASLVACAGCDSDRSVAPDTAPPRLDIRFPTSQSYDENGDALADFRVSWTDVDGEVDAASFKVRVLTGLNGPLDGGDDVLPGWRVEQRDSGGIRFHETIENLLHGGLNKLELSVSDKAGNITADTLLLQLPAGAFFDSIPTGVPNPGGAHVLGLVVCPDDRRAYATAGRYIVVVDTDSLRRIGAYADPNNFEQLRVPLCVPEDPILYVTLFGSRFDRSTLTWASPIAGTFGTYGIAQSRADPNRLYVGEYEQFIGIDDRAQARHIGELPIPRDTTIYDEYYVDLAVLPADRKIYATRQKGGGILVFEPTTGRASVIDLDPDFSWLGATDAIELSADGKRLYVALRDAVPRGLLEIDTDNDNHLRRLDLSNYVPQALAISPSGQRIFISTQDRFSTPSQNVLVDVSSFEPIAEFPRPRTSGMGRIDGGVAFHPNGKFILVGRTATTLSSFGEMTIDVYLNRE